MLAILCALTPCLEAANVAKVCSQVEAERERLTAMNRFWQRQQLFVDVNSVASDWTPRSCPDEEPAEETTLALGALDRGAPPAVRHRSFRPPFNDL